ncbi:hypothetical protein [Candidatus Lokiarchaeum ossiferum]|uniref:hypothetical protein n=1 Tax=Candidatus Lokiarchaeum ossiferum TaxID=2951803 RepID=UPI00352F7725
MSKVYINTVDESDLRPNYRSMTFALRTATAMVEIVQLQYDNSVKTYDPFTCHSLPDIIAVYDMSMGTLVDENEGRLVISYSSGLPDEGGTYELSPTLYTSRSIGVISSTPASNSTALEGYRSESTQTIPLDPTYAEQEGHLYTEGISSISELVDIPPYVADSDTFELDHYENSENADYQSAIDYTPQGEGIVGDYSIRLDSRDDYLRYISTQYHYPQGCIEAYFTPTEVLMDGVYYMIMGGQSSSYPSLMVFMKNGQVIAGHYTEPNAHVGYTYSNTILEVGETYHIAYDHAFNEFIQKQCDLDWKDRNLPGVWQSYGAGGCKIFKTPRQYYSTIGNTISAISALGNIYGIPVSSGTKIYYDLATQQGMVKAKISWAWQNMHEMNCMLAKFDFDPLGNLIPPASTSKFVRQYGDGYTKHTYAMPHLSIWKDDGSRIRADSYTQVLIDDQGQLKALMAYPTEYLDKTDNTYYLEKIDSIKNPFLALNLLSTVTVNQQSWWTYMNQGSVSFVTSGSPTQTVTHPHGHISPLMFHDMDILFSQIQKTSPLGFIETLRSLDDIALVDGYIPDYVDWWDPDRAMPGVPRIPTDLTHPSNLLTLSEKQEVARWIMRCNGMNPSTKIIENFVWDVPYIKDDGTYDTKPHIIDMRMYYFKNVNAFIDVTGTPEFAQLLASMSPYLYSIFGRTYSVSDFTDILARRMAQEMQIYWYYPYTGTVPATVKNDFY